MKKIIIALIIFLILSFGFLAYAETRQASPQSQNWWVIYFANPKNDNLNFVIENNSDQTKFHWAVLSDKDILKEADVEIAKGAKKEINLTKSDFGNLSNKKISITVVADNEKKEIYKNF
ncbi:MAG: hypothetical protein WC906_00110 [Parcubacteria group bacterium]|jgi:hypothetical protein